MVKALVKQYYVLTKPGIVYSNVFAASAGFIFGANKQGNITTLLALVVGTAFVIACGCVLNNILDIRIDALMNRTKKRALVTGMIFVNYAYIYATLLGVLGVIILATYTNSLTVICGILGLIFYVIVYGYAKRTTHHSTLIGTISGALPPVAGYVAATNKLDMSALLLFLMLVTWQMPHFYAIALRRIQDYKNAKLPILPIAKGLKATKIQMQVYIVLFAVVIVLLSTVAGAGIVFGTFMTLISVRWMQIALTTKGLETTEWAKKVFLFSLISLVAANFFLMLSPYVV